MTAALWPGPSNRKHKPQEEIEGAQTHSRPENSGVVALQLASPDRSTDHYSIRPGSLADGPRSTRRLDGIDW